MPIRANTEGAAALVQHWMVDGIGFLQHPLKLARRIQRNVGQDEQRPFSKINISVRGAPTVRAKVEGSPITSDAPANTNVDLTLAFHDYASWSIEDSATAQMNPSAYDYFRDHVMALGEKVEERCAGLYAGLTAIGTAGSPLDEAGLLAAKQKLSDLRCPADGRFAFISDEDENALLGIDKFSRADARGNAGGVISDGMVGRVLGFDILGSQLVAETVGPPRAKHNIFGNGLFAAMASRPLPLPPSGTGAAGLYIVDPATGLSFRYTWGYSITEQKTIHTVDILWGLVVVDPRLAIEVTT